MPVLFGGDHYMLSFCGDSKVGQNGASGPDAVPAAVKGRKFVRDRVRHQTVHANAAAKVLATTSETAPHSPAV